MRIVRMSGRDLDEVEEPTERAGTAAPTPTPSSQDEPVASAAGGPPAREPTLSTRLLVQAP